VILTPSFFEWLPRDRALTIDWERGRPPISWVPAGGVDSPARAVAPAGAALDVSTAAGRRRATWALLQRSGKPTDGWLSRTVHRRVSRTISYILLLAGLRANDATFLTIGIGGLAAWFIAQTSHATMIAGGFLFWFASIADGVDGEMARLTLSESSWGDQLDTFADTATYVLCIVAITVGWMRQGLGRGDAALAAAVLIGLPFTLFYTMHIVRRASGSSQLFVETKPIESAIGTAAAATGSPVLKLAAYVWLFFRRESFSLAFFVGSLVTGWRGFGPAGVAVCVVYVLATLIAYASPIDRALRIHFNGRPAAPAAVGA
jgi:phosphatidylglycerophosphate synthase